jgi:putative endonuclease
MSQLSESYTGGFTTAAKKQYWVYIMTNRWHTVLYVGVTGDITRRVAQHKCGRGGVFTHKYNVDPLVYVETTADILAAIRREKQIKGGSREKKTSLIESENPEWRDLAFEQQ